jgi:hypothetical protein
MIILTTHFVQTIKELQGGDSGSQAPIDIIVLLHSN